VGEFFFYIQPHIECIRAQKKKEACKKKCFARPSLSKQSNMQFHFLCCVCLCVLIIFYDGDGVQCSVWVCVCVFLPTTDYCVRGVRVALFVCALSDP
jgi:hypothetical protein